MFGLHVIRPSATTAADSLHTFIRKLREFLFESFLVSWEGYLLMFVSIVAHLRGSFWARKHVLFRSDNEAVVTILTTKTSKVNKSVVATLTTRTSKVLALMHLLRDQLLTAHWDFTFTATHLPGVENKISPFCRQEFRQLARGIHSSSLHFVGQGLALSTR